MSRIDNLARPKTSKAVWATSFGPVNWSNQSLIRPLSKQAVKAKTTPRLQQLATPKKNFQLDHPEKCQRPAYVYSCGRQSMIWKPPRFSMSKDP